MDKVTSLIGIVGKRNTAMTIVSTDIDKQIKGIQRRISAIKHSSKRGQLLKVLNVLKEPALKTPGGKGIFYAAELTSGKIISGHIASEPLVNKYSFGDRIDIQLIMEELNIVRHGDLESIPDTLYYNQEITENLDSIATIYIYRRGSGWGVDDKGVFFLPTIWFTSDKKVVILPTAAAVAAAMKGAYALGIPYY